MGGGVVGALFQSPPPPPFRAHVTGTPDGPTGDVGGVLRYTYVAQNDPEDALMILRYVSWGEFFFFGKKLLLGRFAAQVVSHH